MFKHPLVFLRQQKSSHNIAIALITVVMLLLVATRILAGIQLKKQTQAAAIPYVQTIRATQASMPQAITLPGNIRGWHEAPIYARTTGYVKQWNVDIGEHVTKGQLLAIIETPELNAQLRQAEADLNVIIAQNALAQITAERWRHLVTTGFVSKQDKDDKVYAAEALSASVIAARARCDRLRELVGFERIIAPFTGTIVARSIDIGALISTGNTGSYSKSTPLFRIVQADPLRLYINIPETYVSQIKPNMRIEIQLVEYPGQRFFAQLIHTAKAIDPHTRTLLAEFKLSNKQEKLLPGSYTHVTMLLPSLTHSVQLPVNALLFRAEGLHVATLDQNNRVVLKPITITRDLGTMVEVNAGINVGEPIIVNPSDAIHQGELVRIAE